MKRSGPPPKPRAQRVLEGNPSGRKLPPDVRPNNEVEMPPHLQGDAAAEWRRVSLELRRLGLLTTLDRAALAAYCQCWARWLEAEKQLRCYGAIVKSPTGYPMQSPYLAIAQGSMKLMQSFLLEFGMSPAARTRVDIEEPPPPDPRLTVLDGKGPSSRFFRDGGE